MFKPAFCEDSKPTIIKYQFVEPICLNVIKSDGTIELTGYGIGDIISVKGWNQQYCICTYEPWTEISLEDGSFLLDPDNRIKELAYVKNYPTIMDK